MDEVQQLKIFARHIICSLDSAHQDPSGRGKVSAVYLTLSDETKKQAYDRQLDDELVAAEQDENPGTWFDQSYRKPSSKRRRAVSDKAALAPKDKASPIRTHYQNLHVDNKASAEVIRAAYKALVQKWHPDKNPNQREKAERYFRIISDAFEILSDPAKRAEYDIVLAAQQKKQDGPSAWRNHSEAPPPPKSKPRAPARKNATEGRHPWRRFWARLADTALFTLAGLATVFWLVEESGISPFFWTSNDLLAGIVLTFASVLTIEAIMVYLFGTTIGKFLLGIRVTDRAGAKLSLKQSTARSFYASLIGAGAYTVIGLFTALAAKDRLKKTGSTYWDDKTSSTVQVMELSFLRMLLGYAAVAAIIVPIHAVFSPSPA